MDAFRPGLLMGIGGLLGAIGTQLFVLGNGTSTFYAARMTEGIAAAASTPATLAHLTGVGEELPERRGSIMSWFELSLLGGLALGAPLAGFSGENGAGAHSRRLQWSILLAGHS